MSSPSAVAIAGCGVSARAPHPARTFVPRKGGGRRRFAEDSASFAGYNPGQPMATIQRVIFAFIFVCLAILPAFAAENWDGPAAEASKRIVALAGYGPLSFEVRNASSIPDDQVKMIRQLIENDLRARRVELRSAAQGYATVRVTLSENYLGWVWIVEMPASGDAKTSIIDVPRESSPASPNGSMTLRRSILFAGKDQILDAAALSKSGEHVVVLSPSFILVYKADASTRTWNLEQSWSIPHQTYPRDLRGRLQVNGEGEFTAFLPGIRCQGKALQQEPAQCTNSDDPWWLAGSTNAFFNSARNHFTGVVPGLQRTLPPFYSAAPWKRQTDSWLVSTIDGQVNLLDGTTLRAISGTRDWGSDIAVVRSGCGAGSQVIATAAGSTASDSLRAFDIADLEAIGVSVPLVFEGKMTALWTKPQGDSAVAVIRTPMGTYEAYSVSIACSQ